MLPTIASLPLSFGSAPDEFAGWAPGDGSLAMGAESGRREAPPFSKQAQVPPTDEELLRAYRDFRDPKGFQELVRRYQRELYRYLVRYLDDSTLAEDVLQNTLLLIHLKCDLYQDGRPVRPWIYTIATNQAIDAMRRAGRSPALSLDEAAMSAAEVHRQIDLIVQETEGPLSGLLEEERCEWVRENLARLPERLRQILILIYYQKLKYREIADILDLPLGTVKSRLHLALAKLRERAQVSHSVVAE
jgi:RNA polymerase sigma-70 factor (ECF subfamily)